MISVAAPEFSDGVWDPEQEAMPETMDLDESDPDPDLATDSDASPGAAQSPGAPTSLPSAQELADPESDGRELFQRLRAWVRAKRQAGRLDVAGGALGRSYRHEVFAFLCAFSGKKTVFRRQAQEMLQRLNACEAWHRGGASEGLPLAEAMQVPEQGTASVTVACLPESLAPAPEDDKASVAIYESVMVAASAPPPSLAQLEDHEADAQEILQHLSAWVEAGRRRGSLGEEAAALEPKHRAAIIAFVCGQNRAAAAAAAPSPLRRGSWASRAASAASVAGSVPRLRKVASAGSPTQSKGVNPECYYVLQSLAGLNGWFEDDTSADRTEISRTLAQLPRAAG